MLVDSVNVEVTRRGCAAKLVMRGPVMGLELKLTAADLDAIIAYLQGEAVAWREAYEKNYYTVLGVDRTASRDDIKKSYRKRARQVHPDLHSGAKKSEMEQKFQELNTAHEVLSDPDKRNKYDQSTTI